MSEIALVSRPDGLAEQAFANELRARAAQLGASGAAAELRLYLADVDPSPLSGAPENDTARPGFDAAVLVEPRDKSEPPDLHAALEKTGELRLYLTHGRVLKRHALDAPAGQPVPGFTMVSPVFRSAGISHDAFDRHWLERHGPLALRHHPGMSGYEQQVIDRVRTPGASEFDGVALLAFRTVEDYRERMFVSDEGRQIIMADTRRFLDLRRSEAVLMSERRF